MKKIVIFKFGGKVETIEERAMMTDININYTLNGVKYNLSIAEGEPDENIASDLAAMFSRAIFDIGVAPLIVIDEIKDYFAIEE